MAEDIGEQGSTVGNSRLGDETRSAHHERLATAETVAVAFAGTPELDWKTMRADLDEVANQGVAPRRWPSGP